MWHTRKSELFAPHVSRLRASASCSVNTAGTESSGMAATPRRINLSSLARFACWELAANSVLAARHRQTSAGAGETEVKMVRSSRRSIIVSIPRALVAMEARSHLVEVLPPHCLDSTTNWDALQLSPRTVLMRSAMNGLQGKGWVTARDRMLRIAVARSWASLSEFRVTSACSAYSNGVSVDNRVQASMITDVARVVVERVMIRFHAFGG